MSDARMPTPESLEVKRRGRHRLIGAITLAVLAVVIIPMVLDSEPRKVGRDLPLTIPPKDGLPPLPPPAPEAAKAVTDAPEVAKVVSAEASAPPAAADAGAGADKSPQKSIDKPAEKVAEKALDKSAQKSSVKSSQKVTDKPADKAAEKAAQTAKVTESKAAQKTEKADAKALSKAETATDKAPEKAAGKAEGFAIQLGAFSDAEKLSALKAKMKSAKVPVFTETVKTSSGTLTRLRAGPYKTREQADQALAQVKKAGVDGQVVPLP